MSSMNPPTVYFGNVHPTFFFVLVLVSVIVVAFVCVVAKTFVLANVVEGVEEGTILLKIYYLYIKNFNFLVYKLIEFF